MTNDISWQNDDLLRRDGRGDIGVLASPAFRMSAYFPYETGHPYLIADAYEALFACYRPVIEQRCDRIRMWDNPGGKARRGKKIKPGDWTPFRHLLSVHDDTEDGIFVGFHFVDRDDDDENPGRGPTAFNFFVGPVIRLDACISVQDWTAGALSVGDLVAALQNLPYVSFVCGYGLCLSERFFYGDRGGLFAQLKPIAERYPALDLVEEHKRDYLPDDASSVAEIGIAGINWLTGIGEPFRTMAGGASDLTNGLSSGIRWQDGPNGTVFQLGERPISGERGVDDGCLPLYHALGEKLAAVWRPQPFVPFESPARPPVFGDQHVAESHVWQERFFKPFGG